MLERSVSTWQLLTAGGIVLVGFTAGTVAHLAIVHRLKRHDGVAKWDTERIVLLAVRAICLVWLTLFGIRAALVLIPLRPRPANTVQDVILIAFLATGAIAVSRVVVGVVNLYGQRTEGLIASTSIVANLARIVILTLGLLIVLQSIGISITPLLTALGVGGLAVALALQDTLANIFAGLHIIVSRQVQRGDYVRLSTGEDGYVTDINWRNTTIRMLANNMVIVPNTRLASNLVTNYHRPVRELAVLVDVGVSYDSDLDVVEKVTVEVAREVIDSVPGAVADFEPFIRYSGFGDSGIQLTAILRAREFTDQYLLKHEFIKRLRRRYNAEGIRIPYPVRRLHIEDFPRLGQQETAELAGAGRER
ncbi:MAG: mechanosensitive ion channel family protein [Chloroflexi bacterium]|nr:mechanosensitive ion channel family protein [Chloroflexota bacterium]